jgi:hypothetical protein
MDVLFLTFADVGMGDEGDLQRMELQVKHYERRIKAGRGVYGWVSGWMDGWMLVSERIDD